MTASRAHHTGATDAFWALNTKTKPGQRALCVANSSRGCAASVREIPDCCYVSSTWLLEGAPVRQQSSAGLHTLRNNKKYKLEVTTKTWVVTVPDPSSREAQAARHKPCWKRSPGRCLASPAVRGGSHPKTLCRAQTERSEQEGGHDAASINAKRSTKRQRSAASGKC